MNAKKEWKWLLNECNVERPKWSYEGRDLIKREMVIMLQVLLSQYQDAKKPDKLLREAVYSMTKGYYLNIRDSDATHFIQSDIEKEG